MILANIKLFSTTKKVILTAAKSFWSLGKVNSATKRAIIILATEKVIMGTEKVKTTKNIFAIAIAKSDLCFEKWCWSVEKWYLPQPKNNIGNEKWSLSMTKKSVMSSLHIIGMAFVVVILFSGCHGNDFFLNKIHVGLDVTIDIKRNKKKSLLTCLP